MKFGRIKRQHGRVGGLDEILNDIVKRCKFVSRIVPGRIKVRRGHTPPSFKIQYPTDSGLKCLYVATGTVQEVFLICSDSEAAKKWLVAEGIAEE
jgi:methyl coenzyme M reductase beta subunit